MSTYYRMIFLIPVSLAFDVTMDGASGGGGESRGGGWTGGGGYDATNQIKQLLRIPTEDPGRASEERSTQKQEKQV